MKARPFRVVWTVGCVLAIGCRPADEIHSYNVPKETAVPVVAESATSAATDRMLAAVLPDGERAWFFKITGPISEVDSIGGDVEEFFASVSLAPGKPHPDWQLPEGWQQQPGSGMRAATLLIPGGAKPLELSVTPLPWTGAPGEMLSNVNRWRGQMQLPETGAAGLTDCSREIKVGDATLTIVDLRGRVQAGGMMPPFARSEPAAPRATGGWTGEIAVPRLPADHPPVATPAAPNTAPFTFDTPAGWQSLPASGIRRATFRVSDGAKEAEVTVFDFRSGPGSMMGDPVANLNRWRGEVGLAPLADAAAKESLKPIEIDRQSAFLVAALPDAAQPQESKSDRGTLAAMLTRGESVWFFKLTGDRDLVAAQRDNFVAFVKSVRFSAPGADDGN